MISKDRKSVRRVGVISKPDNLNYQSVKEHNDQAKKNSLDTQLKFRFNLFRMRSPSLIHTFIKRKRSEPTDHKEICPDYIRKHSAPISYIRARLSSSQSPDQHNLRLNSIDEKLTNHPSDISDSEQIEEVRSTSLQRVSFATEHLEINIPDDVLFDENVISEGVNHITNTRAEYCQSHVADDFGNYEESKYNNTSRRYPRYSLPAMWGRGSGSANLGLNTTATTSRKTHTHTTADSKDKASGNRGDLSTSLNFGASGQSNVHSSVHRSSHSPFSVSANTTSNCESPVVISLEGSVSPNTYGHQNSEPKTIQTVHSRFRQFWVETFVGGRSRTKSENQTPLQAESHKVRFSDRLNEPLDSEVDVLPPHAYTITGGSSQAASILRPLAVYTNLSGPHSDQVSPGFISSGTGSLRRLVTKNYRGVVNGISITPPAFSLSQQSDKLRWSKSPIGRKERFVSTGNITSKSSDDFYIHPKPSKLPREQPVSSLEFTTSRLKNPKKNFPLKTSLDALRRKRAGSLSGRTVDRKSLTISPQPPREFLMEHFSRSEENIVCGTDKPRIKASAHNTMDNSSAASASSVLVTGSNEISEKSQLKSGDHSHHHHHHHHHHNNNHHHHHHHHRHGNHGRYHRNRGLTHTMTRVVESRRYLMFAKSLPLWSAKQYMETHGTGMGESETYAILFQHTPCYDLVPDSAKLILLDSQLTIGKAFKALIYNGIRAAPVWNSENQTFISMLTVTDFVQMLNYCWNQTVPSNIDELKNIQIDDVDQITIQKWKDMLIADRTHRLSLQITSSANKNVNKSMNKSHTTSWPPSNNTSSSSSSSHSSSSSNSDSDSDSNSNNNSASDSSTSSSSSSSSNSRFSMTSSCQDLPVIQLSSNQHLTDNTVKCSPNINNENNNSDMKIRIHSDNTSNNQTSFLNKSVQNIFPARLFVCDPEESIFKALRLLLRFRLHHLPIMDSPFDGCGNILYVLTQRKLLTYLFEKLHKLPQPRFLQSSLTDLKIGTHGSVLLVKPSTRLADALLLFQENYVTALPVVDSITNRRLVNIFSKFDVFTLVLNGAYKNPNLTIQEVLDICKTNNKSVDETQRKPPVEICLASNNLLYVIEKLVKTGYRSLVIVNNTTDYRVDGIISLSDVLRFTVLQQLRITSSRSQPPSVAEVVDERDEFNQSGKQKKKKKLKKEKSFDGTTTDLPSTCSSETVIKSKHKNDDDNNNNDNSNNNKHPLSSQHTPIMSTLHSDQSNTTVNTIITTNTTKTPITVTTVTRGVASSPEHIHTSSMDQTTHVNIKMNKSSNSAKPSNKSKKVKSLKPDNNNKNTSNTIDITSNNRNSSSSSSNLCSDQIILPTVVSENIT